MSLLDEIVAFVAVVERGSFTAAAEAMDMSKSVVSKYVTRLEEELGVRLLHRTTRRLSLTEAGRIFFARSKAGLVEIEEARAAVTHLQSTPRGTLRLNAPMSFGILHIAPALAEFQQEYPEVEVDLNLDDRKVDVIEDGFDLTVRISEMPDSSLVAKRLAPCRHVVVASPEYLRRHGTPRQPQDLERHNVITFRYQESAHRWHFRDAEGGLASVDVTGSIQVNNSLAIREALLTGAGLTRTPTFVVGEDLKTGRLCEVLSGYESLEVSIFLLYPQRRHLSPKVRAFVDFMAARIGTRPYWD